jgi:Protein of unknown function (DUF3039)
MEPEISHYVPFDAERFFHGRKARALCGLMVEIKQDCRLEPTCPTCAKKLAELDALVF